MGVHPHDTPPPAVVAALAERVEKDGGRVLAAYREPVGDHWQLFCLLPLRSVEPTPYQRDLSPAHAKRLTEVVRKLDRFVDPIVVVSPRPGVYWTPNGHHRRTALEKLKAELVPAILVPEPEVAYQILALNTEKAHNLRERSLEVIRMARELARLSEEPESRYAFEFEDPALLVIGICYEQRPRFAGGAYASVARRTLTEFSKDPLRDALADRQRQAALLLEVDDAVSAGVAALKARGLQSPYLRAFIVARINPLRFKRGGEPDFDETLGKMLASAKKFDPAKISKEDVARAPPVASESD
jgi:ParB family chromosome partitioning protein